MFYVKKNGNKYIWYAAMLPVTFVIFSFSAHAVKTWWRFPWMYLWRNSSQNAMNSGGQGVMWYQLITHGSPQRLRSSWGSPSMTSVATVTPRRAVGRTESGKGGSFTTEKIFCKIFQLDTVSCQAIDGIFTQVCVCSATLSPDILLMWKSNFILLKHYSLYATLLIIHPWHRQISCISAHGSWVPHVHALSVWPLINLQCFQL